MRSIPDVCEVREIAGPAAVDTPGLLLEVPHGATRAADYVALREALVGSYPDDLKDFFFVNTDVGAPELALALAERYVAGDPRRRATVLRCLVPRTFIDCNRVIDAAAQPQASRAGEVTPGLQSWVQDPRDRALLLERYRAYRRLVETAADRVCGNGGQMLMVHTYAPRSWDVPVDDRIVARLRAEYSPEHPERLERWPLRPAIDLIVDTPEGRRLANPALVERVERGSRRIGLEAARNGAYALHPVTLAARIAERHPGRTLCFEVRRDLLVGTFTPFAEMGVDPGRVAEIASAFD